MLQIISGRFFTTTDIEERDSDAILYSNLSWIAPIDTGVMELRPADGFSSSSVASYAVRYVNRMQRGQGALVLANANDAVEQFRWLASLWFQAYFHPDRQKVELIIRQTPRTASDQTPPQRFVRRFLDPALHASANEVEGFAAFVRKATSMPRERYRRMVACLGAFIDALEVIGSNFDLAYSMLVYVLEALSRTADEAYVPNWADYDEAVRSKLEPIFTSLVAEARKEIQDALLCSAHLKLKQRFISFVADHLSDSFFTTEAENVKSALPRSRLEASLRNLYDSRSGFVHGLEKVRDELRIGHRELQLRDYAIREHQPYLTFAGLVRLTRHVLVAFIERQHSLDKEDYPTWTAEIPGIVRISWAPQYWIANGQDLTCDLASEYFGGLLQHLVAQFPSEKWECPDMSAVLARIETLWPTSPEKCRRILGWLYFLCCWRHSEFEERCTAFQTDHEEDIKICTIEGLAVWSLTPEPLYWPLDQCEQTFDSYLKQRYKRQNTLLPVQVEIAIAAGLANAHLIKDQSDAFDSWIGRAILDAAGMPLLQHYLALCRKMLVPISLQSVLGMEPFPLS